MDNNNSTQLTYRFKGRTAQPLERTTAPGCDEPTSRCQTSPSMWTLGEISLLSLEYLLSVERWPFHVEPPDHYGRLSSLLELSLSQSGGLMPLHSAADVRPA